MFNHTIKEMLDYTNLGEDERVKPQLVKFVLTFEDISIEYDYTLN